MNTLAVLRLLILLSGCALLWPSAGPAGTPETGADKRPTRMERPSPTAVQADLGLNLDQLNQRVQLPPVENIFSERPSLAHRVRGTESAALPASQPELDPPPQAGGAALGGAVIRLAAHPAESPEGAGTVNPQDSPLASKPEDAEETTTPSVTTPAPPVIASAPPFPFKYIGLQRLDSGETVYFLTKGNQLYTVEAGQTLESMYSVDGEENGALAVTFLPLQLKQTILPGASS